MAEEKDIIDTALPVADAAKEAARITAMLDEDDKESAGELLSSFSVEKLNAVLCEMPSEYRADAILTPSQTGHTARMISRFRPGCPIIGITTTERARRQLAISWGVTPILAGYVDSTDRLFSMCVQTSLKEGVVNSGDMVVITAGVPIGRAGSTNLIKAQTV